MKSPSILNRSTTTSVIRNEAIYLLPARFYLIQLILLGVTGLIFTWISRHESWDLALTRVWFDPVTQQFPWKDNRWLDLINHRLLKDVVIAAAAVALVTGLVQRNARLVLITVLIGVGPLVVGILKANSAHSCPWDLVEFGGKAVSFPLFSAIPLDSGPGRCFPGGHASSGFGMMALFFWYWPRRPARAWCCFALGVTLGMVMGYGQMMRGAHFLSHNLWAGWWAWLSQCLTFGCVSYLVNKTRKI
ncbi:phosphatase PAP2 family protein [Erwinia sp. MMLR14_017]|uniref:phosphatase PAP2 family protein n=1 Tax=Erwinia sp. MMLR14_017 TaxID=3093842 RepID=UPI002990801A|nr:phosphatase PAP2 family protein [Erwinia sp. MMLR14_017]MDW8848049.1 phosphatase PAP2 family protein [Erwinia sp. MMLR14_017]